MSLAAAQAIAEPWMRGTHTELDALRRGVVHALELAGEDVERWAAGLTDEQMFARPGGAASVGFHLTHLTRSLDRLLSYAEDRALDQGQLAALANEAEPRPAEQVLAEVRLRLQQATERVRAIGPEQYEAARAIGRKRLPTTTGGLLVHVAEHTSRHVGQMVTTVLLVRGLGNPGTAAADRA